MAPTRVFEPAVFPSAELGIDKPSPHAYRHAARTIGIQAHLFTGPAEFTARLRTLGLPLTSRHGHDGPPGRHAIDP